MVKFQELLNKIKEYKGDGTDYFFTVVELGNHDTGEKFEKSDLYQICSPRLKKEARKLIFGENNTEDGGFCRLGMRGYNDKHFSYEKGKGNQPDKFEIRDISLEEKRKEQEQARRDREQAERDRQQAERDRKKQREREREREFPTTRLIIKNVPNAVEKLTLPKEELLANVPEAVRRVI